jgi:hypothetical protein
MEDNGPGTLQVGLNEFDEVIINLPKDMTGHIVFSADQARHLAKILIKWADIAQPAIAATRK